MDLNRKLFLVIVFFPLFVIGQGSGIRFESDISWKAILTKAKEENKYIFVDCYATWCGPCKWMNAKVFPQKEVGDFFNSHFINVAVQMDRTSKDLNSVQDWYGTADSIAKDYGINEYPTYLFFSPDGRVVHRITGAARDGISFIDAAKDALDPQKQYYALIEKWRSHMGDSVFLFNALTKAQEKEDWDNARAIGEAYLLTCQKELTSFDNTYLIYDLGLIRSSNDRWFRLFLDNEARINQLHDEAEKNNSFVERAIRPVIYQEELKPQLIKNTSFNWKKFSSGLEIKYPELYDKLIVLLERNFMTEIKTFIDSTLKLVQSSRTPDWKRIWKELRIKYPDYDFGQVFWQSKAEYCFHKQQWEDCAKSAYLLLHGYGNHMGYFDINEVSWYYIFMSSDNRKIILEAVKWMRDPVKKNPHGNVLDTYANLLYKIGNKEDALKWENKAVDFAVQHHERPDDLQTFRDNLAKMEAGKKTWGDN